MSSSITTNDWRWKGHAHLSTLELSKLRCPFKITPEQSDTHPKAATDNVYHFTAGQPGIPYTGYYAPFKDAKISVTCVYGVWFEFRRREDFFEAHRVARPELLLTQTPLNGIDMVALVASREALTKPPSRAPSRTGAPAEQPPAPPPDIEMQAQAARSSPTTRQGAPWRRRPRGTGDDPFGVNDLSDDEDKKKDHGVRLEGDPPAFFKGDRSKTVEFLAEFKRFMMMNRRAAIAHNLISKSTYFLSRIRGTPAVGWKLRHDDWRDKVEDDPSELPFMMNAWDVLQREFKKSFEDYAK